MKFNILIGGEAGQGLNTMSEIFCKSLLRMGYYVFATKDYMSRVRGGHNFNVISFSTDEISGSEDKFDLLIALNEETISIHGKNLKKDGLIICDEIFKGTVEVDNALFIPAKDIAKDINIKGLNTVFIGAALRVLGFGLDSAKKYIHNYFSKAEISEDNIKLLEKGYELSRSEYKFTTEDWNQDKILLNGNTAIALGAIAAGLKCYFAYPMSPATGIMNYLIAKQELGLVVEQTEDEIAAINMALGASYGGVRAMTGTSGGGFALMAEGMSLAGITETPLVIAVVQRPGPGTGLPTRTEQSDLLFSINIGHGEFPRLVISPKDQNDAFYQTFQAFNLAEKYQIPVIILSDQFLADTLKTVAKFELNQLKIERHLLTKEELAEKKEYSRYAMTDDGVSPRAYPGQSSHLVIVDSDEHDEKGHIIEDAKTRKAMVEKRFKKLEKFKREDFQEPKYLGEEEIDYLLITWGSTYGPTKEAFYRLKEAGFKLGLLSFSHVWPLPVKTLKEKGEKVKVIVIENNMNGQFAKLIESETDVKVAKEIHKYDGRPFGVTELYKRIKTEVSCND